MIRHVLLAFASPQLNKYLLGCTSELSNVNSLLCKQVMSFKMCVDVCRYKGLANDILIENKETAVFLGERK